MSRGRLTTITAISVAFGSALSLAGAQGTLYVDDDSPLEGNGTSWNTAYRYLQDALQVATHGE